MNTTTLNQIEHDLLGYVQANSGIGFGVEIKDYAKFIQETGYGHDAVCHAMHNLRRAGLVRRSAWGWVWTKRNP
jgi:hypothetical protein